MSARRATPEVRLVPMSSIHRDAIQSDARMAEMGGFHWQARILREIVAAWDAAPADPVVALAPVIARHGPYAPAWRLLEALGYPDGSPRQETPT